MLAPIGPSDDRDTMRPDGSPFLVEALSLLNDGVHSDKSPSLIRDFDLLAEEEDDIEFEDEDEDPDDDDDLEDEDFFDEDEDDLDEDEDLFEDDDEEVEDEED